MPVTCNKFQLSRLAWEPNIEKYWANARGTSINHFQLTMKLTILVVVSTQTEVFTQTDFNNQYFIESVFLAVSFNLVTFRMVASQNCSRSSAQSWI